MGSQISRMTQTARTARRTAQRDAQRDARRETNETRESRGRVAEKSSRRGRRGVLGRIAVALATLAAALCIGPGTALADDVVTMHDGQVVNTAQTTHVKQGTDGSTFASASPVSTILISSNINTTAARNAARFEKLTDEPGFQRVTSGSETNVVVYDNGVSGATPLQAGQYNTFAGDLFSFTFSNMATLQDGSKADVVITYSNAQIALRDDCDVTAVGQRSIAAGNMLFADATGFGSVGNATSRGKTSAYGLRVDARIQVMKGGQPVDGTFFYPMTDIDVVRGSGFWFGGLPGASENNNYSEQVVVRGERVADADGCSVYVPDAEGVDEIGMGVTTRGYKAKVEDLRDGGVRFVPTKADTANNDAGSFYSGFATVANNGGADGGLKISATSSGAIGYAVRTFFLAGVAPDGNPIVHNIVATRTGGGSIQTTEHGNLNGDLADGSGRLGPAAPRTEQVSVVPDGKTVVYTMTPGDGYRVKEITVDGNELGVEGLNLASGASKDDIAIDTGIVNAKLKNVDGRTYTFEFPTNNADHRIHVEYAADYHFEKVWQGGETTDLTLTATPYTYNKTTGRFVLASGVEPKTFVVKKSDAGDAGNTNVVETSAPSGSKTWSVTYPSEGMAGMSWPALPIEIPNTKSDDDLLYWYVTEAAPSSHRLEGYDNSSCSTFTNFGTSAERAGATIKANVERAYMSFYKDDGGVITNVRRAEVRATKEWDDYNNGFGTRREVTMHVRATVGGATIEDVLPARTIAANASGGGLTVAWGTGERYVGKVTTGTGEGAVTSNVTVYASLADLQSAHANLTFTKDANGITYSGSDGSTYYVNELPAYDASGAKIAYATSEDPVAGYSTTPGEMLARDESDASKRVAYEQTYRNRLDNVSVPAELAVSKLVEGSKADANLFSFTLVPVDTKDNSGKVLVTADRTPRPTDLTVSNSGDVVEGGTGSKVTFGPITFSYEDMLEYEADGTTPTGGAVTTRTFTYQVSENDPADSKYVKDDAVKTVQLTVTNLKDGTLTVTQSPAANTRAAEFNNSLQKFDLTATKEWDGGDASEHTQVKVKLRKVVDGITGDYLQERTIQESDHWTTTWNDVPRYERVNGEWRPVTYALFEEPINGYTTAVTADRAATDTFRVTTDASVDGWDGLRSGQALTLRLLQNGVPYKVNGVEQTKTLTGDSWDAEWDNLPQVDASGSGVVYLYDYEIVDPATPPAGYDAMKAAWKGKVEGYDPNVTLTVTNTKQSITVHAQKVWNDGGDNARRGSFTMTLDRRNTEGESLPGSRTYTVTDDEAKASGSPEFKKTWGDGSDPQGPVPVTTGGQNNVYVLTESAVPNYYSESVSVNGTINLGISTDEAVRAAWGARPEAKRPTFTVQLLRNGTPVSTQTKTLSSSSDWGCSWEGLPTVDPDGTVLVYDWRVVDRPADWVFSASGFADQYGESNVAGTDLYDIKMRNTLLTDVKVAKKWVKESLQNVDVELMRWKGDAAPAESDYTSTDLANWEPVGSAYRHTFAQSNNYTTPDSGDKYTYEEYTFTKLPAFDASKDNVRYYYRVRELTTGTFFSTTYEHTTTPEEVSVAVNTSTFEANGQALVGVVKNIEGRTWLSGERHSFTIAATGAGAGEAPLPHKANADGTKDTTVAEDNPTVAVTSSSASVSGTARFAYFDPIFFETAETDKDVTFTYAITEDIPDDAVGTRKSDGATTTYGEASVEPGFDRTAYAWTKGGLSYSTETATVRINFKVTGEGDDKRVTSSVEYVDLPAGAVAPAFTNTYDVEQDVSFPIAKRIRDYAGKNGDGFVFTVTPVGDAPAPRSSTVELGYVENDADIHEGVKQTNGTSPTIPIRLSDLNLTDAATGLKYGTFIYEVRENHGTNTRFSYTDRPVYVRLTVRDMGNGTLDSTAEYFRDATCKTAVPTDDSSAATFENSVVRNVQVTKEWHGPVMCDTTLRVERRYADGSWGPAALTSGEANPFTILRNRFASLSGTDVTTDTAGREVRSITHTFDGLPAYDVGGEKIAYRVVETAPVASNGFTVTYRSDNGKASDDADYVVATDGAVLDSDKVTVTNTYDHGTTAQIAVVKELLGRTWLNSSVDTYNFVLTAVRNGTSTAAADLARVPMPGGKHGRDGLSALTSQSATGATPAMKTGTKVSYADEYLALFAPITVDVSDLTFDSSTGRMKGDFYYTLQEVRPASQTPAGSDFAVIGSSERFVYQGVTYAAGAVHTVHVRVTDDMRGNVVSRTYFDEDANGIGTWFTPVITNHYDATGAGKATIVKYILGDRPWSTSDSFSFKMRPVGNAPWRYPAASATDANGALSIKLDGTAGSGNYRTVDTPELTFRLSDLTRTTTAEGLDEDGGAISYSAGAGAAFAGRPVPAGLKYDTFLYAISETGGADDKLIFDTDVEYVRFTVIDKGDGTLDVSADYLPAADASPREFAAGDPVGAPFTNIEKKDINVTKVWDGLPTADTVVALKRAELSDADLSAADKLADGATAETRTWGHIWKAAESDKVDSSDALNPHTSGAPAASGKTLVGYDGKVFEVSQGSSVAGFASGSGTTYFEVPSGYSIIKVEQDYLKVPDGYFPAQVNGETFFVPNDERQMWKTVNYRTFTTTEFAAGSEVTERFQGLPMQVQRTENNVIVAKHVVYYVDEMPNAALYTTTYATTNVGGTGGSVATRTVVVTNRSTYASTGTASVRVIKDLQGRAWHRNVADDEGGLVQQEDQFRFTLTPLGRAQYDEVTGAEKADLLTDGIPMPAGSAGVASMDVSESSDWRTDSQREAGFANINIGLSDLTRAADGTWKGDFYYRLAEHIGDDYVALEKVTDEGELKTIQNYHTIAGEKYKAVSLTWGAATAAERQSHVWWLDTVRSIAFTSNAWGVHVHAQDAGNGTIATTITYEDNSSESSDYITTAPAYTNYYDASGLSHTAIIKHIAGRDWKGAEGEADAKAAKQADGSVTLAGDAFRFKFQQVGGAVMDPTTGTHDYTNLRDGIVVDADTWMTPAATSASVGVAGINNRTDRAIRSGEGIYHLDQLTYNNDHNRYEGSFVHVINEVESHTEGDVVVWPKVADMEYDKTNVYMQTLVWDKGDGTLGTWHRFFTDATCSADSEIVGHEVWVDESGYPAADQSLVANATETVTVGSSTVTIPTYTDEDGHVFTRVNAAYFFNSRTIEIPVTKKWVGMPVESVTLHLQRALVRADKPIDEINDAYVMGVEGDASQPGFADANAQGTSNFETWRAVGHVATLDRGDFLKADGTPDYDASAGGDESNTVTRTYAGDEISGTMRPAIDGFNKDLPMFVVNDGKIGKAGDPVGTLYRAIYRLVEDDTSDTYKPTYSRVNGTSGENYYVDQGTLVVTNTTTATNEANITAGKQLVDRTWSDSDVFTYTLTPLGKGTYHTADTAAAYNSEHSLHEGDEGYVRAGDLVTTTTGTGDATRTKVTLATDGAGQAVTSGVPMPEAARQVEGYDKALDANQAIATTKTAPLGEGEHLARFGAITYGTDILELNPTGRHLQGDYYYEMREDIPAGAIAIERQPSGNDASRRAVRFSVSGGTAMPSDSGDTLTYEVARGLSDFDLGAYYWKVPYDASKSADQNKSAGYDGILYDGTVHTVHVQVRENRTDKLQVVVAYDETNQADTATGLAFTPIFTNHYETETPVSFNLVKSVRGGNWGDVDHGDAEDLRFFFEIHPTSGAPFRAPEGVRVIEATDPLTEEGVFQKMSDGGVFVLVKVPSNEFNTQNDQDRVLPAMLVRQSDLGKTVNVEGKDLSGGDLTYSNGTPVPAGVAYDRFVYYLREAKPADAYANVKYDTDEEYVQVTVVDGRDGTLDYQLKYFKDRACTQLRRVTRTIGGQATVVDDDRAPFTNAIESSLVVRKEWDGVPSENATVVLERNEVNLEGLRTAQSKAALNTTGDETAVEFNDTWYAVPNSVLNDEGNWRSDWRTDTTHTFNANDIGADGKAEWVVDGLITQDIYTLTDKTDPHWGQWTNFGYVYRVTETAPEVGEGPGKIKARGYGEGDKYRYSYTTDATALAEGDDTLALVVTNTSNYKAAGTASISVVKQLIGREWKDSDDFTFLIEPKGRGAYDAQTGELRPGVVDSSDAAKALARAAISTAEGGDEAHVKIDASRLVSVNEYSASFPELSFATQSSELRRTSDGSYVADYYYTVREKIDGQSLGLVELTSSSPASLVAAEHRIINGTTYAVTTDTYESKPNAHQYWLNKRSDVNPDGDGVVYTTQTHEVRAHLVDNGRGSLTAQLFYDGDAAGDAAPVFTNYYDAAGPVRINVRKHIVGGNDAGTFDGAYRFELVPMPGAAWGTETKALYTTVKLDGTNGHNDVMSNFGEGGDFNADGWFYLSDLNGASRGSFVYAIHEVDPANPSTYHTDDKVEVASPATMEPRALYYAENGSLVKAEHVRGDELAYDDATVYAKVDISDNGVGELVKNVTYYTSPDCSVESQVKRADGTADDAAAFANAPMRSVKVRKVWANGEPISESVIHLQSKPQGDPASAWQTLEILPKVFYKESGTGESQTNWQKDGSAVYSEAVWEGLPAAGVNAAGNEVPIEYRVEEGSINMASTTVTYSAEPNDATDPEKTLHFNDNGNLSSGVLAPEGTLIVTNDYSAKGVAEVNAVKQLLGREWGADDSFGFELTAAGLGKYYSNAEGGIPAGKKAGDLKVSADGLDLDTVAAIPMPGVGKTSQSDPTVIAVAPASNATIKVADNERLATFAEIRFDADALLAHNDATGRLQGDFFYTMREIVPDDATATTAGGETQRYGSLPEGDARRNDASIKWLYKGVSYTRTAHSVHVQVRDYGTGSLVCRTYYDEATPGDTKTATRFTPVFTNRYNVAGELRLSATKTLNYRAIGSDETFTVRVVPLAGSPMPPANAHTGALKQSLDIALTGHDNNYTNTRTNLSEAIPLDKTGTYLYEMYEVLPATANASGIDETNHIQYDLRHVFAQVVVTDDVSHGGLSANVRYYSNASCTEDTLITQTSGDQSVPVDSAPFTNAVLRDIEVDKVWKGDPASDVTLTLERTADANPNAGTAWEAVDSVTIAQDATGDELKHTFKNLRAFDEGGAQYTYRVSEAAGENYSTDAPKVLDGADTTVAVTNTNTSKTTFTGHKAWVDNNNAYATRPADGVPTLKLYRTTGEVPASGHATEGAPVAVDGTNVTLEWDDTKSTFTYGGLPQFDAEGRRYAYWAIEEPVAGYEAPVYRNLETGAGTHTDRIENGGTVTNTIKQEKTSVTGAKTWHHGDNPQADWPTSVTVHLQANGSDVDGRAVTLDGGTDAVTTGDRESGAWQFTFGDLDVFDANGAKISYAVREETVNGYAAEVTGDQATGFSITNTYRSNRLDDVLKVAKSVAVPVGQPAWEWGDDDRFVFDLFAVSAPAGVTQPMPSGSVYGTEVYKRIEATKDNQSPSFGAINFDAPGTYVYRVREMTPAESNTTRLPGMTYDTEAYTVTVEVNDAMQVAATVANKAGESIAADASGVFTLPFANHFDKSKVDYIMVAEKAYMDRSQLDENGTAHEVIGEVSGKFGFTMRPVGENAATAPMPTDYYSSTTRTGLQGSGAGRVYHATNVNNRVLFEADGDHAIEFTEEHAGAGGAGMSYDYELAESVPEDAVYVGNGFWYNDADETVYDGVVHTRTLTVRMEDGVLTVTPSGAHGDRYLDPAAGTRYGDAGSAPTATWVDTEAYPRHKNNVPQFLNYKDPKTRVTATKVWDDANDQDGRRPERIAFKIWRADRQSVRDVFGHELTEAELTRSIAGTAGGTLTATWDDLPRYERVDDGASSANPRYRLIRYEVTEVDGDGSTTTPAGYTSVVTGDDESGFTITNVHVPKQVDVTVTKEWEDEQNRDGKRPDAATFHIDQHLGTKVTTDTADTRRSVAADGWKTGWTGLAAKQNGQDLTYTLREDAIEGYAAGEFVEGDAGLRVTLEWGDGASKPAYVTATLVNENGDATSAAWELNEGNGWTAIFDGLDKAKAHLYSVSLFSPGATQQQMAASRLVMATVHNYTITNTYEPGKIDVSAIKRWVDGSNAGNTRKDVTIALKATAAGRDVTDAVVEQSGQAKTRTIAAGAVGDALTATWADMPTRVMVEGVLHDVTYAVDEEQVPAGYAKTVEGDAASGFTITNTLDGTTKVEGTKAWVDGGRDHDNAHEVTLQLWRRSAKGGTTPELTSDMPAWDGNGWSFTDLPAYDAEGYAYRYYVVERNVMGYETTYTNADEKVVDRALDGATITNTLASDLVSFSATKQWVDENNTDGLRADVTLHLDRKIGEGNWERMGSEYDRTISAAEGAEPVARWANMPATRGNDRVTYRVVEEPFDGYTVEVTGDQSTGFTVTNTHTPGTAMVHATKVWDDNDNADRLRPSVVTMHLIASTEKGWSKDMGTAEARGPEWRATWSNMPTHHDGDAVTYSVVEESVAGYYVSGVSEMARAGDGAEATYECTVTNKRMVPTSEVSAAKVWLDGDNQDGKREEVVLRLEALGSDGTWGRAQVNGTDVPDKLMSTDTNATFVRNVSIDANGHLTDVDGEQDHNEAALWTGLPAERTLSGASLGTSAVSEATGDSTTSGNQAETSPEGFSVDDADDMPSDESESPAATDASGRKEGERVDAEGNGGSSSEAGRMSDGAAATATSSAATNATTQGNGGQVSPLNALASFLLPRRAYADEVTPILYRVVEYHVEHRDGGNVWVAGAPEGYVAVMTQTGDGTFVVTNVHQVETRDFSVRKAWDDSDNKSGSRPSSVTVQLLANGEALGAPVALTGGDWSHTWTDLPAYRAGDKIDYTVEETEVPTNYTSSGVESVYGQYVITNVYNGPVKVTAIKLWKDAAGNDIVPGTGVRTPEVRMQLYKNGTPFGEAKTIPDAANAIADKMQVTWDGLASFEGGEPNVYAVEETVVPAKDGENTLTGSNTGMTADADDTFTFTNVLEVVKPEPTPDPDKIIKVTYVDHLLGEDGEGGSLKTSTADEELVKVFKVRAGDLRTTLLTKVGERIVDDGLATMSDSDSVAERTPASASAAGEKVATEVSTEDASASATNLTTQATGAVEVPGDPGSESHKGYEFAGWTVNRDQFGDYVMVAHHKPVSEVHTVWVDGQTGETWDGQPGDPAHDGLRFVGWKQVTDAAGNIINVARYEPVSNDGTRGPGTTIQTPIGPLSASSVRGSAPAVARAVSSLAQTSDGTNMVPAIVLAAAAIGSLVAAVAIRRRK